MASPGFGFSVGDFIAGICLVKKLICALNDASGSRAAYRKLIAELRNLEEALTETSKLQFGSAQESQRLALQRVVKQCESSIEAFLLRNAKFNDSLGTRPSVTPPTWRENLHKIQWALCNDTAVDDLRTEIAAHTATLNFVLSIIQFSATKLHEQRLDSCTHLLQAVCDKTEGATRRIEQNQQTLEAHTGMMETMSRLVSGLVHGTQGDGVLSLVGKSLQWHIKIFDAITQMKHLLLSLPPQIEREQPVLFEDAHGRIAPFHVEFIDSFAAFQAVLEVRFQDMPGLRKVRHLEYSVQDAQSQKIIDLSRPWKSNFRPGRRFNMSIVFEMPNRGASSCPGCSTESFNRLGHGESDVQCDNPDCRMFYRCMADADDSELAKRQRLRLSLIQGKPTQYIQEDYDTDDHGLEGFHEFHRVQIELKSDAQAVMKKLIDANCG